MCEARIRCTHLASARARRAAVCLRARARATTRRTRLKLPRAHTRGHGCCVQWHRIIALLLLRRLIFVLEPRVTLCEQYGVGKAVSSPPRPRVTRARECAAWPGLCPARLARTILLQHCVCTSAIGHLRSVARAAAAARERMLTAAECPPAALAQRRDNRLLAPGRASLAALITSRYSAGCWRAGLVLLLRRLPGVHS